MVERRFTFITAGSVRSSERRCPKCNVVAKAKLTAKQLPDTSRARTAWRSVGRRAAAGLEPSGEVIGVDEVGGVATQLAAGLVVEALDGRLFDSPVHSLDLTVGARTPGLGQAMVDVDLSASQFEAVAQTGSPAS